MHVFLTSALDGGEWSASHPGHFTAEVRAPGTRCIKVWVGLRAGLDAMAKRKKPYHCPRRELNPRRPARNICCYPSGEFFVPLICPMESVPRSCHENRCCCFGNANRTVHDIEIGVIGSALAPVLLIHLLGQWHQVFYLIYVWDRCEEGFPITGVFHLKHRIVCT
jgi:hypothetical protein